MKTKTFVLMAFFGIFMLYAASTAGTDRTEKRSDSSDVKVNFRVKWDGRVIPGITHVSELRRKVKVLTFRNGGDPSSPRRMPGIACYEPIVIKRPRTYDKSFEQWANKVWNFGSGFGAEVSLKDYRKDITIEICSETGQVLMAFRVYGCWPSEYVGMSELNADDENVAMETLVLQHQGWERDYSIH